MTIIQKLSLPSIICTKTNKCMWRGSQVTSYFYVLRTFNKYTGQTWEELSSLWSKVSFTCSLRTPIVQHPFFFPGAWQRGTGIILEDDPVNINFSLKQSEMTRNFSMLLWAWMIPGSISEMTSICCSPQIWSGANRCPLYENIKSNIKFVIMVKKNKNRESIYIVIKRFKKCFYVQKGCICISV